MSVCHQIRNVLTISPFGTFAMPELEGGKMGPIPWAGLNWGRIFNRTRGPKGPKVPGIGSSPGAQVLLAPGLKV